MASTARTCWCRAGGPAPSGRRGLCRHQPLLRPGHLAQLRKILDDPEATENDKFVAFDLLKNANISAGMACLPMCQDTGTAIIMGKKGRRVWTDGGDEAKLAEGVRDAYFKKNLRYSQLAPISMFEEKNTSNNMPAQIDIYSEGEDAYKFLFMAKGGGSANKTFLYQGTPSLLTPDRLIEFLKEKILTLGTAACPPYHLAIVIGGTSAEMNLKTVKLASAAISTNCRPAGSELGHAFRDLEMEAEDPQADPGHRRRRAVRRQVFLPRRPRDPPAAPRRVAADRPRRLLLGRPPGARQDHQGRDLPRAARDRAVKYMPEVDEETLSDHVVKIDLNQPMPEILQPSFPSTRSRPACR
jgi:fumarate hydratase class I